MAKKRRTTAHPLAGTNLVKLVDRESGQLLGTFEYEPGYGVHARRGDRGERRTFLTHGYRAAIGSEVVGYVGGGPTISKAKAMARAWVEEH